MRVYVLIAQQTSGIAELPPRAQCCSLCSVVHCTAQCIQHRVGQGSVNLDSHLTLCFVFMSVDPGHTLHIPTYKFYIQLYNKSILQTSSALFHFVYSEFLDFYSSQTFQLQYFMLPHLYERYSSTLQNISATLPCL